MVDKPSSSGDFGLDSVKKAVYKKLRGLKEEVSGFPDELVALQVGKDRLKLPQKIGPNGSELDLPHIEKGTLDQKFMENICERATGSRDACQLSPAVVTQEEGEPGMQETRWTQQIRLKNDLKPIAKIEGYEGIFADGKVLKSITIQVNSQNDTNKVEVPPELVKNVQGVGLLDEGISEFWHLVETPGHVSPENVVVTNGEDTYLVKKDSAMGSNSEISPDTLAKMYQPDEPAGYSPVGSYKFYSETYIKKGETAGSLVFGKDHALIARAGPERRRR